MVRTILSRPASELLAVDCPPDEPTVATALGVAAAGFVAMVADLPMELLDGLTLPDAASEFPLPSRFSVGALSPARAQPDPDG